MEDLTEKETTILKTLCEFLFYDNYQYWATYSRFEKCFQPLFNNLNINLYEVFTGIAGKQKNTSPQGYHLHSEDACAALSDALQLPVYDVRKVQGVKGS